MSEKQPEALRLAELSENLAEDGPLLHCWPYPSLAKLYADDAAKLRQQHALIEQMREALQALTHSLDAEYLLHDDQRSAFKAACVAIAAAEAQQ